MLLRCALFLVPPVAAAVQGLLYYGQLPERLASHFNGAGWANGWMSKPGLFALYAVLMLAMTALFLGLAELLGRLPVSVINLPNREYWLSGERREATLRQMGQYLARFGLATTTFLVLVFQLVFQANLPGGGQPPRLSSVQFVPLLVGYMAFMLSQTFLMVARYSRIPR